MSVVQIVSSTTRLQKDLDFYGLSVSDLSVHEITSTEKMALGLSGVCGYVLPYRKLSGGLTDYYVAIVYDVGKVDASAQRVSLKGSKSHIYIPSGVRALIKEQKLVCLVQGELLAVALYKGGIPAVSYTGAYGWRNTGIRVPASSEVAEVTIPGEEGVAWLDIVLPEDTDARELMLSLAVGLNELLYELSELGARVVLGLSMQEDRKEAREALAMLRWEVYSGGIPARNIRHLPTDIWTFISENGFDQFHKVLESFDKLPTVRYPNLKEFLLRKLTSHRIKRREGIKYGSYLAVEMQARGRGYLSTAGDAYYFDGDTKNLMPVKWGKQRDAMSFHETEFGRYLWRDYGINANDQQLVTNLASHFTEDESVEVITPHRVSTLMEYEDIRGTVIYYQLSDSQLLEIRENQISVQDNGSSGVMFLKGQVNPLDIPRLTSNIEWQQSVPIHETGCWWSKIIDGLHVVQNSDVPIERTKRLHSLLPYVSPWFLKWNGTQLPVEIVTGEGGSGKSSLLELRQHILTGKARLRNCPQDIRDWYAGITSSGGVYTVDNVHFTNKQIQQKLSDEICRIITEADPMVEMRKLYTTAESVSLPVRCTFAITALVPPFNSQDILQRSFPLHLNAIRHKKNASGESIAAHESKWLENALDERGGREGWIAHHVVVLQRLLQMIDKHWDSGYLSRYRLINLEQMMRLVHRLFYPTESTDWIPHALTVQIKAEGNEVQWALDGLAEFLEYWRQSPTNYGTMRGFSARDLSNWASGESEYRTAHVLTNSRMLGKFFSSYEATIAEEVGIVPLGKYANKAIYGPRPT